MYANRSLHVALETAAAMVLLVVASVLLGRYRRTGSGRDLVTLLAVLVLATNNLFVSVLSAVVAENPSAFTTWVSHGTYVLGPVLLAIAAAVPSRPLRRARRTELLAAFGVAGTLLVIAAIVALLGDDLPGQFASTPTDRESLGRFQQQPVLTVLESFAALCFGIAAALLAHHAEREHDRLQMWLAIFAAVASVAFLNYALFPTLYTELVYVGDVLLLAADLALLVGTTREISSYQDAVAEAAVLDERRRVARDLHDGVAQEFAYISTQLRWSKESGGALTVQLDQIAEAAERGLDESRAAIAALSRPVQKPLDIELANTARDVADRLGGRLEFALEEGVRVPPPWRDALAKIVREAVANAIRHGHAGTVSVALHDGHGVSLRVTDDGTGFDLDAPRDASSFGLISMQERTESLGGEFRVRSSPGEGTAVEVWIP